jgi:glycosyltransferase involved in cell wall biosynthesis
LKENPCDLIHAHYSLSGYFAAVVTGLPVIVSLMGSDVYTRGLPLLFLKFFARFRWKAVIVKSRRMKDRIKIANSVVIPNGVDFEKFKPMDKEVARKKVNFGAKKYIIWLGRDIPVKNLALARQAIRFIQDEEICFKVIDQVPYHQVPLYLNAADVLLLTSRTEGSPNVIKEAMACKCPIVSTDVGDVKEVIQHTGGCYITSFNPQDIASKLSRALAFGKPTTGRTKIAHLEVNVIASKIIQLYKCIPGNGKR